MRLRAFQSQKGDCLLLTRKQGSSEGHVLIDGGMAASFRAHVAAHIAALPKLDLVYVSHIDQDHISGILQMMNDLVAWRVHDYQVKHGNAGHPRPKFPRPPRMAKIWHNAFHTLIGENAGPIEELLAASAAVLSASTDPELKDVAERHHELATSIPEAIRLSRRIGPTQLGIPLNPEFKGRVMLVHGKQPRIRIKGMTFQVLGPFPEDLQRLREQWNVWLSKNKAALAKIKAEMEGDEGDLHASDFGRFFASLEAQAQRMVALLQAAELGDRANVTAPNLASLMVLVSSDGQRVLLTGDGHSADILRGLAHHGLLQQGGIHVEALKVQHHGSEHNMDRAFARAVTADHYVFCGNGAHANPDLRIVDLVIDSRIGSASQRSPNPAASRPFTLWFNSSSTVEGKTTDKEHMRKVEARVAKRRAQSGGRLSARFMPANRSFLDITLP